ncbi:MAG: RnfABCDGE type electron transport complex subunit D [Spirochaetaceae bacterium]|jgi:electron transport complex protein RnfD|nr:RnfABCDGE type electron transport complex subunit D [Spirochaetaceae bacterium]
MREQEIYQKPQVNLAYSAAGRMWLVSFCAAMAIIQSSLTDGFASLLTAFAAAAAAVLTELSLTFKKGRIRDGSAVTSALILVLLLPNTIHPVFAALGAVFAMAVVKHGFGGLGANWLNPALGGWLFIRFSWPGAFNRSLEGSPLAVLSESLGRGFSDPQGSPLAILKISGWSGGSFDGTFTSILNKLFFFTGGVELPGGYIAFFNPAGAGIIADRGLFCLLLGTIVITAFRIGRFYVPLVYLGVYALLIRLLGALPLGGTPGNGDMLFGLLSGGTLAAAFLLAADPATGPKSAAGALISAALAGAGTFIFRYQGLEPYGAFFAIALLNALAPLIRGLESRSFYSRGEVP